MQGSVIQDTAQCLKQVAIADATPFNGEDKRCRMRAKVTTGGRVAEKRCEFQDDECKMDSSISI